MGVVKRYIFEFDDPYKILASMIIGYYRPIDVVRILTDDDFILNQICKETRSQDMKGRFTDCIITDILENKDRMKYMAELDKLSAFYYSRLDKERLREEIGAALKDSGIRI